MSRRVRITLRMSEVEESPRERIIANYGDSAADGWMEGDIQFDDHHEISLTLVGAVRDA